MALIDNLEKIRYRLREAAERVGRNPDAIHLIAVTKYAPLEAVRALLESGKVDEVAESRVQDAQAKKQALGPLAARVQWRLIGHLQTNKAKKAAEVFDAVDSVDSVRLAEALNAGLMAGRTLPVLVQVKLTQKDTQHGVGPDEAGTLLDHLKAYPNLKVRGFLAIAPMLEPVEAVRPHFRRLKELFDRHFAGVPGAQLSMGMSRDFELAVEEGATHVRIGSQIFS